MSEQAHPLLDRANGLLQSGELRPKATAVLLLKLSQFYALFSSDEADSYWEQLKGFKKLISGDEAAQMAQLSLVLDEEKAPTSGFAREKIDEIKAMLGKPDLTEWELRAFLEAMEEEVQKRFWPGGKQPVWEQLVLAWKIIDRSKALALTSKLSSQKREMLVRQMNREKGLSVEEWGQFGSATSKAEVVKAVTSILEDPSPTLVIPQDYIAPVISGLVSKMTSVQQLMKTLDQITLFISLVTTQENLPQVFDALKDAIKAMANSIIIGRQWAEKFSAVLHLTVAGASRGIINKDNISLLTKILPKNMVDFCLATSYAMWTDQTNLKENFAALLDAVATAQRAEAEAWFLVLLTERQFGEQAYELASVSPNKFQLQPRVCRAWLLNDARAAISKIQPDDIRDDIAAQILYRREAEDRVDFLREMTQSGQLALPGALWVAKPDEEEKKGFWASLWSSGKPLDEIIREYLRRNPLYASYQVDTQPADQFKEYLRFRGYGEYSCKRIDPILLEVLVHWADKYPEEVDLVLNQMWQMIEPDDNILKIDFLRNAILGRCTTVFAADPEFLADTFITWLKRTLVDRTISWQSGNTQYNVRYPEKALVSMCIQGAAAVHEISPIRRDRLVELALTRYPADDQFGEIGAQLYNADKDPLDIKVPWKTSDAVVDGWQVGIVKNALPGLIEEIIAEKSVGETA